MATIFPSKPVGPVPITVLKTFRFLKALPDDYLVWHHLAPWQENKPDFLVFSPNQQALMVKVSNTTSDQLQSSIQMMLIGQKKEIFGEHETRILQDFHKELNHRLSGSRDVSDQSNNCIRNIVLCPNLTTKQLTRNEFATKSKDIVWLGKEYLDSENTDKWLSLFSSESLDGILRHHIRAMFTPEVVVPKEITVRRPIQRNLEAGLKDFMLDYNQEMILKTDLDLSQEADGIAKDFQTSLVNGVAGSGKTLILLYRLRLLYGLFPSKTFLVLTHNKPLIRDIQKKFYKLQGDLPSKIKWQTFYGFLYHNYPHGQWRSPVGRRRRDELIRKVWLEFFKRTNITEGMLRSEIDWIQDQVDRSRDGYLSTQRRGRGFRLSQQQRSSMYAAYQRYCTFLKSQNTTDWGEIPHSFWDMKNSGRLLLPTYDVLLIDEAQFFAPIWFEIIRNLVKPRTGHVFFVADPTQGFLNRGVSWKSMGLEVRGHSYHLKRSYRTTQEILTLATIFYRHRLPLDEEGDEVLEPEFLDMPEGVVPQLVSLLSSQDEIARVTNEVDLFVSQGIPKSHILILHANWQGVNGLINSINRRLGFGAASDPKKLDPGDFVRVTTINAGTGLESPIVFLIGVNQLIEEEKSLHISDEERELLILENTRKIYMAITRAGQRLVLTYVGEPPDDLEWMF